MSRARPVPEPSVRVGHSRFAAGTRFRSRAASPRAIDTLAGDPAEGSPVRQLPGIGHWYAPARHLSELTVTLAG
jgi:hypothetical protein